MDALFKVLGPKHRSARHHTGGVEQVHKLWGDRAAQAPTTCTCHYTPRIRGAALATISGLLVNREMGRLRALTINNNFRRWDMAKRKVKEARAEDQTTVTFSCAIKLKETIQKASDSERRSVSNWIVCRLEDAIIAEQEKAK